LWQMPMLKAFDPGRLAQDQGPAYLPSVSV